MIIKSIKLENIRSYLNQEIEFPEGSVLLSGDIGSGKSSVLLAIDFAFFGIQKGTLSGNALLRNGKNKGSVELRFIIDDKDVVIKRTLKKAGDSIVQDNGFIVINGKKREATAVELRQAILDLLNYPQELLTKSKSLIYKYTVYTPQEEMKHILLSEKEVRLDIIRRVFGIDKYKRIKDNNELFLTNLRGKTREFAVRIGDLNEKESELTKRKISINEIEEKLEKLSDKIKELNEKIKDKKQDIKEIETKIKKLNELNKELSIKDTELRNKLEQKKDNSLELKELEIELRDIEKEIKAEGTIDLNSAKEEIKLKENEINVMENTLKKISYKISEFTQKRANSEQIKIDIGKYDVCPLCKQEVTKEHKHEVLEKENKASKEFTENVENYEKQEKETEKVLVNLRQQVKLLEKNLHNFEILKLKTNQFEQKKKKIDSLTDLSEKLKKEIGKINVKRDELFSEIKKLKDVEELFEKKQSELENLQDKERDLAVEIAGYKTEMKDGKEIIGELEKEINEKIKIRENLIQLKNINEWLENHFIRLINTIERQIMLASRKDFSDLFEKWFNILVDNEGISAKLDDEYSLLVEQNGYEIDYLHLSGGEKTAAALAYRLALNQVINHLMSAIKTRDVLILDEPTDGFSENQLERMKVVLDEVTAKQIIIVSHESKIESFVDNVIRFNKQNHITQVN